MKLNVFYSWQSDLENKYNRSFIQTCIEKAIGSVKNNQEFNLDLILDRDTKGEAGTPDIVNTIFEKIRNSHLFICDISFIDENGNGRRTPNPNVLIELGYAASILGWDSVICIFNTGYGALEDLPFDLRTRRILQYKLTSSEDKSVVSKTLVKAIESSLISSDFSKGNFRRAVLDDFASESSLAQKIALNRYEWWEFALAEELLRSKLKVVNRKYEEIQNGSKLIRRRSHTYQTYMDWLDEFIDNLQSAHNVFQSVLPRLAKSFGDAGESGDPFEIKRVVDLIAENCNELVNIENDILANVPPEKLKRAQEIIKGITANYLEQVNLIPESLKGVIGNEGVHNLTLNFELPQGDELSDFLSNLQPEPSDLE